MRGCGKDGMRARRAGLTSTLTLPQREGEGTLAHG
jgi:hypothetical protein